MPPSSPHSPGSVDWRHSASLVRIVQRRAPDLWLAARFLDRSDREALLALGAFVLLIADVVAARDLDAGEDAPPGEGAEDDPATDVDAPRAGADDAHGAASCACGAASLHGRVQIAHNIIAFVFEEQAAREAGRAEIEAFAAVREARGLARAPFDELVQAWAALAEVQRIATRAALDRLNARVGAALAQLVLDLFADLPIPPEARRRGGRIAAFTLRARQLLTLREAWRERGCCLIPLEDLAACGLRDLDLESWLTSDAADRHRSPADLERRCAQLIRSQADAALAHLAAGAGSLESLGPKHARALAAFAGCWGEMLLDHLDPARVHVAPPPHPPRGVRFRAWRHAIGRRFSPRLRERLAAVEAQAPLRPGPPRAAPQGASPRSVAGARP